MHDIKATRKRRIENKRNVNKLNIKSQRFEDASSNEKVTELLKTLKNDQILNETSIENVDFQNGDTFCQLDEESMPLLRTESTKFKTGANGDSCEDPSLEDFMDVELADILQTELNIHSLFPIQKAVMPFILKDVKYGLRGIYSYPNDAYIWAPTGTGKTIAFAVPLIMALRTVLRGKIRAIVILPTQNLAVQVGEVFSLLSQPYDIPVFISGKSVLSNELRDVNSQPPLILITTPGRLVDYLSSLDLCLLRFIVFDEADRLLCEVKHDWIRRFLSHINRPVSHACKDLFTKQLPLQKILASATLELLNISELDCWKPVLIVGNSPIVPLYSVPVSAVEAQFPSLLTEGYIFCSLQLKPLVLKHFLIKESAFPCLIFVRSRESTRRLACLLQLMEPSWHITQFTADNSTKNRTRVIKRFNDGKINILITSDALARGMDLLNVRLVVLYDPPTHFTTYVHRVGRTARAGRTGLAVTMLCSSEQLSKFKKVTVDRSVSEFQVDSSDFDLPSYENCLNKLSTILSERARKKIKKTYKRKKISIKN